MTSMSGGLPRLSPRTISAKLIAEFYRQLQDPSISRAVALQRAQQMLLAEPRYGHPALWSPFLLINNWL